MKMNVLITGASGGLGRAMAMECARRGYNIFLTDINETALLALYTGIVRQYDVSASYMACDLTRSGAISEMLGYAGSQGLRFDMLLNVAGVDCEGGFTERSAQELLSMISINVDAAINLTHQMLERRGEENASDENISDEQKPFYIVFVSSLASLYPMPLKAAYAASKRFLYDFAYALGSELEPQGVKVTTLCPGGLATNDESLEQISAQGIWGDLTTNPVETIARRTISKVLRGRRTYIPGFLNTVLGAAGKVLPRALIAWAIKMRWQKARKLRVGEAEDSGRCTADYAPGM